jgi:hypothetical protein
MPIITMAIKSVPPVDVPAGAGAGSSMPDEPIDGPCHMLDTPAVTL